MVSARPDWDTYFLGIAKAVAERADCTRRQVGCVLVDRNHRIIATGYNGAPPGEPGCKSARACPRGRKSHEELPTGIGRGLGVYAEGDEKCIAIHAEDNAVRYAAGWRELSGATAYVTCEPCDGCYALLKDVGIGRIVFDRG